MAQENWGLLSQADEDALHTVSRLLNVESRRYESITKAIEKSDTSKDARPVQLPSPPPDASAADEDAAARQVQREQQTHKMKMWEEEVMNELELLDHAVLRSEFTMNSNRDERERYAREKIDITAKQDRVKVHIEELRVALKEAQDTLAVRKTYDELAEKITSSKMLKPRDEQAAAHMKLDQEIQELEDEVASSKNTWDERRVQFGRIEEEAREMLRMIKDEKEEAERKEGMMKDGDDEAEGEGSISRGELSHAGTPRADGDVTPMHVSQNAENAGTLKVPQERLAPLSQDSSAAPSPARSVVFEDSEMAGSGASPDRERADDSLEEGEDVEEGEHEDGRSEMKD